MVYSKKKYSKRKYSKRKYSKRKYSRRKYSKKKNSKKKYSKIKKIIQVGGSGLDINLSLKDKRREGRSARGADSGDKPVGSELNLKKSDNPGGDKPVGSELNLKKYDNPAARRRDKPVGIGLNLKKYDNPGGDQPVGIGLNLKKYDNPAARRRDKPVGSELNLKKYDNPGGDKLVGSELNLKKSDNPAARRRDKPVGSELTLKEYGNPGGDQPAGIGLTLKELSESRQMGKRFTQGESIHRGYQGSISPEPETEPEGSVADLTKRLQALKKAGFALGEQKESASGSVAYPKSASPYPTASATATTTAAAPARSPNTKKSAPAAEPEPESQIEPVMTLNDKIRELTLSTGFTEEDARNALRIEKGNLELAGELIISGNLARALAMEREVREAEEREGVYEEIIRVSVPTDVQGDGHCMYNAVIEAKRARETHGMNTSPATLEEVDDMRMRLIDYIMYNNHFHGEAGVYLKSGSPAIASDRVEKNIDKIRRGLGLEFAPIFSWGEGGTLLPIIAEMLEYTIVLKSPPGVATGFGNSNIEIYYADTSNTDGEYPILILEWTGGHFKYYNVL